ncbi:PF03932 family protein CutC [Danaus plexippus]|uniref:Copper homeostasis protein cutC homolog n=1 Tax=Danaus plexippus plexippus TaxID=278856 RepID=A0A212F9H5_DANPL|nr:PF03932 family protein CutC [Danaus plexippus]OWR50359.1 Copper homeostasis protein cutC [Danaus plexippus plexippus]
MLEVCVDSLESAVNAVLGGADELELCSCLVEGGLTPSPGLVTEVLSMASNSIQPKNRKSKKVKVNVMIRCRGGSHFSYNDHEMTTMLADIKVYKDMGVDRFVFGALTENHEVDKINCAKVLEEAGQVPVTFHRAFDLCRDPRNAVRDIIEVGFDRILTSGQKPSAVYNDAIELYKWLLRHFGSEIQILPGAGITCENAPIFMDLGFEMIHSSCKIIRKLDENDDLDMGDSEIYVTDEEIVRKMKDVIQKKRDKT